MFSSFWHTDDTLSWQPHESEAVSARPYTPGNAWPVGQSYRKVAARTTTDACDGCETRADDGNDLWPHRARASHPHTTTSGHRGRLRCADRRCITSLAIAHGPRFCYIVVDRVVSRRIPWCPGCFAFHDERGSGSPGAQSPSLLARAPTRGSRRRTGVAPPSAQRTCFKSWRAKTRPACACSKDSLDKCWPRRVSK